MTGTSPERCGEELSGVHLSQAKVSCQLHFRNVRCSDREFTALLIREPPA